LNGQVDDTGSAAPRSLRRPLWTAVGFMVGSALFAVGVPLSLGTSLSPAVAGWTFFAGSVFFTAAAFLQFLTSREGLEPPEGAEHRSAWLAAVARPRTLDWTASAVQLLGTLAFNVTTLRAALDAAGTGGASPELVWRPDAFGSVLFLVSSGLAFAPEIRWRRHRHARDRSWAIAALNLTGSVFFGASAIGAYPLPGTDMLLSTAWSNGGTLAGAICFFAGAALLVPRRTDPRG
jgi:hypothetical protein